MERQTPERIDSILDSLEGMERATPAPFLHTRVLSRMERPAFGGWSNALLFLSRPAVALSMCLLLLGLNAYVLFSPSEPQPSLSDENGMAMVQDYDVHYTASYEPLSDDAP